MSIDRWCWMHLIISESHSHGSVNSGSIAAKKAVYIISSVRELLCLSSASIMTCRTSYNPLSKEQNEYGALFNEYIMSIAFQN